MRVELVSLNTGKTRILSWSQCIIGPPASCDGMQFAGTTVAVYGRTGGAGPFHTLVASMVQERLLVRVQWDAPRHAQAYRVTSGTWLLSRHRGRVVSDNLRDVRVSLRRVAGINVELVDSIGMVQTPAKGGELAPDPLILIMGSPPVIS